MNICRNTLIATLALLAPAQLLAIPAWSRAGATDCSTCHATPTWQLNYVGLDFLRNGHRNPAAARSRWFFVTAHHASKSGPFRKRADQAAQHLANCYAHFGNACAARAPMIWHNHVRRIANPFPRPPSQTRKFSQ